MCRVRAVLQPPKESKSEGKGKGNKPGKAGKPAKVVAKTGGMATQWDILISMGLTPDECVHFVDPLHWLKFSGAHRIGRAIFRADGVLFGFFDQRIHRGLGRR